MAKYRLSKASLYPPAVVSPDAGDEENPWILIENEAYVADRHNSTTAFSDCGCDGQVQVSLFVATPPRVSYLCVFGRRGGEYHHAGDEEEEEEEEGEQMFPVEPKIVATYEDLFLLRIAVSDGGRRLTDFFVYQPAGDGGPLLTRLERPSPYDPCSGRGFNCNQVGLVSCTANRRDDHNASGGGGLSVLRPNYMVAALSQSVCDSSALASGRFILHLYSSELQTWTAISVSLLDQHYQKYKNEEGYFFHRNTKVIAVGGEDATIAFVDLWRGILVCDLSRVQDQPWLRYVPLPFRREEAMILSDARLSRDIAVVEGCFKYVLKRNLYNIDWASTIFTRPVSSCSRLDDKWEMVCGVDSVNMDTKDILNFHLLPKPDDSTFPLLSYLYISQPTLSLDTHHTVCFMAKDEVDDHKAWVITVDMQNNRLIEVAEFDTSRYYMFAYQHSKISKNLKMAQGNFLLLLP